MNQKIILRKRIIIGVKKPCPRGLFYKSKEKIRASFLFLLIKKTWWQGWSKSYSTKRCALNQGEEKLFLEKGAFFIKDKIAIAAKFSVNISRRYVMYIMCSTSIQTTFGIQQRLCVLEIFEILSCGNLTRTHSVLTALN